jgi:hypothetical protein
MTKLSFADAVKKFGATTLVKIDRTRRASIIELFNLVINASPVDTGRLRGNWQTSINAPILTVTERLSKDGAMAKAEAMANLGSLMDVVYMMNNLPYVERIEYEDYSKQAPGGMVRKNVVRWSEIVEAKAKEYMK